MTQTCKAGQTVLAHDSKKCLAAEHSRIIALRMVSGLQMIRQVFRRRNLAHGQGRQTPRNAANTPPTACSAGCRGYKHIDDFASTGQKRLEARTCPMVMARLGAEHKASDCQWQESLGDPA